MCTFLDRDRVNLIPGLSPPTSSGEGRNYSRAVDLPLSYINNATHPTITIVVVSLHRFEMTSMQRACNSRSINYSSSKIFFTGECVCMSVRLNGARHAIVHGKSCCTFPSSHISRTCRWRLTARTMHNETWVRSTRWHYKLPLLQVDRVMNLVVYDASCNVKWGGRNGEIDPWPQRTKWKEISSRTNKDLDNV